MNQLPDSSCENVGENQATGEHPRTFQAMVSLAVEIIISAPSLAVNGFQMDFICFPLTLFLRLFPRHPLPALRFQASAAVPVYGPKSRPERFPP